jgi:hypothetical protein
MSESLLGSRREAAEQPGELPFVVFAHGTAFAPVPAGTWAVDSDRAVASATFGFPIGVKRGLVPSKSQTLRTGARVWLTL